VHVLQGERDMAADNKTLGKFILSGIPPAPRGIPQVEVTFDIDANGILNVSAQDKATGKEQKITITASSGLAKEEIEKMKKDAESHAEEDKKRREAIETKNMADTMIYTAEKLLKDAGDKVSEADKKAVQEKIDTLKKLKEGDDAEAIKKASEELSNAAQKIGAAMYQKEQAKPSETKEEKKQEQGPVEGEYEEVKDEDKDKKENK
jgi:molecular chaperone DnaK